MNTTMTTRSCVSIVLFVLLACTHTMDAQNRQLFSGTVMGYDGTPMKDAHVELWRYAWGNRWAGTVNIDVGSNGRFISKLLPGLYTIQFAGVDHEFSERRFIFIDSTIDCTLHARLERSSFISLAAIDTVFLAYVDPAGSTERFTKPMTAMGDGRFELRLDLSGEKDPLFDLFESTPLLLYHIVGIVPDRWVNGTDQDYYEYDGDGDFFSVKKIRDTVMTVHFDYNALTAIDRDLGGPEYRFHIDGAPLHHPYAMLAARKEAYRDVGGGCGIPYADSGTAEWDYYIAQGVRPLSLSDTVGRFAERQRMRQQQADSASVYLSEIREAGESISQERLESLLLLYLNAVNAYNVRKGTTTLNESAGEVTQWVQKAMDAIPPTSPVWSAEHFLLGRFRVLGNDAYYSYVKRVMRENPSPTAQLYAFDDIKKTMRLDTTEGTRERLNNLYEEARQLLEGTVAESEIARIDADPLEEARKQVAEQRKIRMLNIANYKSLPVDSNVVGRTVPAFTFYEYPDSSVTYTNASLAGKPYILCLEYVSEMDHVCLEDVYDRYADQGLRVVMPAAIVHRNPQNDSAMTYIFSRYRPEKDPPPWPVLQAEDDDLNRMRREMKAVVPGFFLVNPEGVVVASGWRMEEFNIELSVEKYFEGKLE